jgi:hypothetical protein
MQATRLYNAGKAPSAVLSGEADLSLVQESKAKAIAGFISDLGVPNATLMLCFLSLKNLMCLRLPLDYGCSIAK